MNQTYNSIQKHFIEAMEALLSALIVAGLLAYAYFSIIALSVLDWHYTSTFEEFVQRVLFAMIGIELLQIIRVHALRDIFLVSILLLVRKALMPSSTTIEMVALVMGAILIIAFWQIIARHGITKENPPL